jgi:hypothetical protein
VDSRKNADRRCGHRHAVIGIGLASDAASGDRKAMQRLVGVALLILGHPVLLVAGPLIFALMGAILSISLMRGCPAP